MRRVLRLAAVLLACVATPAVAQSTWSAPQHSEPWPGIASGNNQREMQASLATGPELQRGRSAKEMLADRRKLDKALAALQPQRKGVVDAYVLVGGSTAIPSSAARRARPPRCSATASTPRGAPC